MPYSSSPRRTQGSPNHQNVPTPTSKIENTEQQPIPIPQASSSFGSPTNNNINNSIVSGLSNHFDVLRGNTISSIASNEGFSSAVRNNSVDSSNSADDMPSKMGLKTHEDNESDSSNIFTSTGRFLLRKLSSSDNLSDSNGSEGASGGGGNGGSSPHGSSIDRRKSINGLLSKMSINPIRKQLPLNVHVESMPTIVKDDSINMDLSSPLDKKTIPKVLITDPGLEMVRVTHRKKIKRCFKIDLNKNILSWNNKSSSYLYIDKIRNIRTGDDAKNYREEFKVSSSYENLWITIIYHNHEKLNNIKALHLIATRKEDYYIFLNTLRNLVSFRREVTRNLGIDANSDLSTVLHWNNSTVESHTKENDELTFDGVLKLASRLHIHLNQSYLKALFSKVDRGNKKYLTFDEFKEFVSLLRARNEIRVIYDGLCKDKEKGMTFDDFYDFLVHEQFEVLPDKSVSQSIFNKFANSGDYLQLSGFSDFLISSYTVPLKKFQEDFSRPLNEYFISSSHNTYLLGKQVNGVSSIEGYVKALQRGCRCIEIDIWDGDSEPIVTHGRTFTSSIGLRLVVETIRKYAFITSPYPVILSLEIRCSLLTQLMVVEILKEVLAGMLLDQQLFEDSNVLPTPEQLKHKILVKVKKNSAQTESSNAHSNESLSSSDISGVSSSSISEDNLVLKPSTSNISSTLVSVPRKFLSKRSGSKKVKIAPELAKLGVYLVGVKFRNFSLPESKVYNHVFSFSEKTLKKMTKDEVKFKSILKHNNKFLMRVYPSIYRFSSENFNPLPLWELGTQLVATNWQVFDLGQQLNEAMFAVGNNCGYVLKPKSQIVEKSKFKKRIYKALTNYNSFGYLNINIISAQQLTKPKDFKHDVFDPYVELEIYGAYATDISVSGKDGAKTGGSFTVHSQSTNAVTTDDETENDFNFTLAEDSEEESAVSNQKDPTLAKFNSMDKYPSVTYRTSKINRNGFNPIWDQRCKATLQSNENQLVFLRFVVKCSATTSAATTTTTTTMTSTPVLSDSSANDTVIGVFCCKLDYLKKGYRHLPLCDLQGEEYIFSTLFVHIDYDNIESNL